MATLFSNMIRHPIFSQMAKPFARFNRVSLSVRVSFLLVLAALLPLAITIASSELLSRPLLISQANTSMETDAQAHIQAIENYFSQPIIDVSSLSENPVLANYLNGNESAKADAMNVLSTGYQRNINYMTWSLIDVQGNQRLSYPVPASPHGKYFIPPNTLAQLNTPNRALASSAFYNPQGNTLTVDLTEPVILSSATTNQVLGFVRATLNVNFIWNTVLSERGVNGQGSYAFIVDNNGVIIAHTDITKTFTAIAPFTSAMEQDITSLERYGKGMTIPVVPYDTLDQVQKSPDPQTSFQMTPPGQNDSFQVIRKPIPIVPWTYFVLSPTNVVTTVANQQLFNLGITASIVLFLAGITGLIVGRRITAPVLQSAKQLQLNSQLLKDLATKEQTIATEQLWVVDSSQTGLSSVHYYIDATQMAARQTIQVGTDLEHRWPHVSPQETKEVLKRSVVNAYYIDSAVKYQKESSSKLSAAIELTKQVTEQLASSAESATHAAKEMEEVVDQLQQVVGKN